jgi:glycosyltransferase involved in cell wall biosynthesis
MLGVEDGTRVVLAVAREEYPKGLDLLLEAFPLVLRELPRSVLVVAGGRGKQTPLHRETAVQLSLGDSVRFLGPREDVPELLCAADVFVLPSRREGFPGVLLEAMALEAPIVATDLPPVREVLGEDGIGGLVSWEAPGELGRAIVESLRDGEAISRRVRSGRFRFLKEFDVAGIAERMLGFYERALASGRRASR